MPKRESAYGINKARIERWLLQQTRRNGFPATSFRPRSHRRLGLGTINPQGNANPEVFSQIARGENLC